MQAAAAKPAAKKRKASDVAEAEPETVVGEEDSEANLFSSPPKAPPRASTAGLDRVGRTVERTGQYMAVCLLFGGVELFPVYAETRVPVHCYSSLAFFEFIAVEGHGLVWDKRSVPLSVTVVKPKPKAKPAGLAALRKAMGGGEK